MTVIACSNNNNCYWFMERTSSELTIHRTIGDLVTTKYGSYIFYADESFSETWSLNFEPVDIIINNNNVFIYSCDDNYEYYYMYSLDKYVTGNIEIKFKKYHNEYYSSKPLEEYL